MQLHNYLFLAISFFVLSDVHGQCTGSGTIDVSFGNPSTLDPDGDGDIVAGGTTFSGCNGELAEFEQVTNPSGCSSCQIPWTAIGIQELASDLWGGGGCGNTDIVTDNDGGKDFAYFSIIDLDGSCNSGDELIAFRIRISNNFSGNFGFDFLVSNDGLIGVNDPDGISCCSKIANAGFEYEVQLKTGSGSAGVNVYDIDGVVGTDNCPGNSPCSNYPLSSHAQKSTACGSACGCRSALPAGDPVFLTFIVPLSDLGVDCNTYDQLTFVPVSSTSGNPVIAKCSSASDVGGLGLNTDIATECPTCVGASYPGCDVAQSLEACGFGCAAENNSLYSALPVELISFKGKPGEGFNQIDWITASEYNTEWFIIERSDDGINDWTEVNRQKAKGFSYSVNYYSIKDGEPLSDSYYRLRSVDFDRTTQLSYNIIIHQDKLGFKIHKIYPTIATEDIQIVFNSSIEESGRIIVTDINGRIQLKKEILFSKGTNLQQLDLNGLSPGLHTILISNPHQQLSAKIIKTNE